MEGSAQYIISAPRGLSIMRTRRAQRSASTRPSTSRANARRVARFPSGGMMPRSLSGAATVSASTGEKRWPGCGRAVEHRPGSPDRHPSRRPLAEPATTCRGYVAADSYDVFFDWQWQHGCSPGEVLKDRTSTGPRDRPAALRLAWPRAGIEGHRLAGGDRRPAHGQQFGASSVLQRKTCRAKPLVAVPGLTWENV